MELTPQTRVDRYTVLGPLGQGGMASVHLVRHQALGTLHALKVLHSASASMRARLMREGQVQGSLQHTNVLSVTDVVDVGGVPGLVMPYVEGPSLAELLGSGRLSASDADALARPIMEGVAAAHRAGLVHRDLKPANVLLAIEHDRIVPKVADFGLAKLMDGSDTGTRTGVAMGTPAYMAPEQFLDASKIDARADVFALGCTLYEMLAGSPPFSGDSAFEIHQAVLASRFVDLRSLATTTPDEMVGAVHGAMVPELDDRLEDVTTLLARWAGDRPQPAVSAELLERARNLKSDHKAPATSNTWTPQFDSVQPETMGSLPETPDEDPPTVGRGRWLGVASALALGVVALGAWFAWPVPAGPALDVMTTAAVPEIFEDPTTQRLFEEGWQDYLATEFRASERKLAQVVASDPADPLPWLVLGQSRLDAGNQGSAVQALWTAFGKAQHFDSPVAELIPIIPRMATEGAWEGEVEDGYRAYVAAHPQDYLIRLMPIEGASGVSDEHVEALFADLIALDDRPAIAWYRYATEQLFRGHWDQAERAAREGLKRTPGSPNLLQRLGRSLLHRGEFDEAREVLNQAAKADPALASARADLAVAAVMLGDEELHQDLTAQVFGAANPMDDRAAFGTAVADGLLGAGRVSDAVALLARVSAAAEAEGNWPIVAETERLASVMHEKVDDLDGMAEDVARLQRAVQAPELSSQLRQRMSEIAAVQAIRLAAYQGDLQAAEAGLKRVKAYSKDSAADVLAVEQVIGLQTGNVELLHLDAYPDTCVAQVRVATLMLQVQAPGALERAEGALARIAACSAIGDGRIHGAWLKVRLAERIAADDPTRARALADEVIASLPQADPDLSLIVRARALR